MLIAGCSLMCTTPKSIYKSIASNNNKKIRSQKRSTRNEGKKENLFNHSLTERKKRWLARLLYILKTVCVWGRCCWGGSSRLINLFTWKTRNMVDISSQRTYTHRKNDDTNLFIVFFSFLSMCNSSPTSSIIINKTEEKFRLVFRTSVLTSRWWWWWVSWII